MHHGTPWLLLLLVLALPAPGAAAFYVSSSAVSPAVVNPSDPVNVSCTVFAASGTAFSTYDDLQFVTMLDDPVWTYSIVVDEIENIRPSDRGRYLTISGYELHYPEGDEVIVNVALKGRIPANASTGANLSVVKVQELDTRSRVIASTVTDITHLVGQPTPVPTPEYGAIQVSSEPVGANVYLDNTIRGITPMTIKVVPNGPHTVLLRLDGYDDYEEGVTVNADMPAIRATLALKPVTAAPSAPSASGTEPASGTTAAATTGPGVPAATGSLSVTTNPAGALVYIDGQMKGISPATIPGLSPGTHTIRLILDGYQDFVTTTDISAGTTSEFITGLSKQKQVPGFTGIAAAGAIGMLLAFGRIRNRKP